MSFRFDFIYASLAVSVIFKFDFIIHFNFSVYFWFPLFIVISVHIASTYYNLISVCYKFYCGSLLFFKKLH